MCSYGQQLRSENSIYFCRKHRLPSQGYLNKYVNQHGEYHWGLLTSPSAESQALAVCDAWHAVVSLLLAAVIPSMRYPSEMVCVDGTSQHAGWLTWAGKGRG